MTAMPVGEHCPPRASQGPSKDGQGGFVTAPPASGASDDPGVSWAATPFVTSGDAACASPGVGRIADCSADASDCRHLLGESPPGGAEETRRCLRGGRVDRADADCNALGSTTPVPRSLLHSRVQSTHLPQSHWE